jgi:serine/threonine protein kinase
MSSAEHTNYEETILRRIQDGPVSHPGRRYFPELLDSFSAESPHGIHKILVRKVSGTSLVKVRLTRRFFTPLPTAHVKQWMREVLFALDYLHTHVGVIHSGI